MVMDFKDRWRGIKVPNQYRTVFFHWDNATQQETELDAKTILDVLAFTPEGMRDANWAAAERAVLDAPLQCRPREASVIPNRYEFPHWDGLYQHQQEKANTLSLSERDFRNYDPEY